ncbi:prostate stem cell antigen-like [Myripristis murdjan]|uniref:Lymphocyte antigen-6, epidermis n=1 Tax=Myripristis murdjan TaxID=586833 RepID=A0A667X9V5_9TELE|nr:prostate stem cell antigen-like [Myripristis murdjan]
MNRIILRLFAAGICLAIGHALQCYKCDIGIGKLCITSKTTCAQGELCFSGEGKAAGFMNIKMKGCLEVAKCNKTENVDFPTQDNTTIYSMTKTCCDTDLCNAAPGLPRSTALPLTLATLTAVFMVKVLV